MVGFPNVGKSTLISRVSAARPKIADYHFTTLVPNLGMVSVEDESFVMADIPGIIEGAHAGAGLGHEFLRHIERTRLLLHVLDVSGSEGRDPIADFQIINRELKQYSPALAERPMIVVPNKMDVSGAEENLSRLKGYLQDRYEIFPISAVTGEGIQALLHRVIQILPHVPPIEFTASPDEHRVVEVQDQDRFRIDREDAKYVIKGKKLKGMPPWLTWIRMTA